MVANMPMWTRQRLCRTRRCRARIELDGLDAPPYLVTSVIQSRRRRVLRNSGEGSSWKMCNKTGSARRDMEWQSISRYATT